MDDTQDRAPRMVEPPPGAHNRRYRPCHLPYDHAWVVYPAIAPIDGALPWPDRKVFMGAIVFVGLRVHRWRYHRTNGKGS